MVTRQARLLGRLAFIIAILLVVVGAGLIARHMDRTFAPVRARGNEWVTIADVPSLPEPPIQEYAVVIGQTVFGNYGSWHADRQVFTAESAVFTAETAEILNFDFSSALSALSAVKPPSDVGILPSDQSQMIPAPGGTQYAESPDANNAAAQVFTAESAEFFVSMQERPASPLGASSPPPEPHFHEGKPAPATAGVPIEVQTTIGCVETILKEAVIEPYCVNGQIEGLRITGLETISAAADMPLKSGDIIRAINGQPLDSKRRALKIFKKARTLPTMMVEILRDGQTKALLLDLR